MSFFSVWAARSFKRRQNRYVRYNRTLEFSRRTSVYPSSKEYVLESLENYDCKFYTSKVQMGRDLDLHHQAMRKANYNSKQIAEYWEQVLCDPHFCNCQCPLVEMFVKKGFAVVFRLAEEITMENRITSKYIGISLGMLKKLSQSELLNIKDWDKRRSPPGANGHASSLLLHYDPNLERLRYGKKCAAH